MCRIAVATLLANGVFSENRSLASNAIGLLALVGVAGAASQWIAWRVKLPSILLLLSSGILLGPVLSVLQPDELLGDILFPIVSIAVAIILFEGGLTLDRSELRGHGAVVRNLLIIGVVLTWFLIAFTVHLLFHFPWALAFLFGSIGVVTGPTVIKPLLRIVRPKQKIAEVLRWEGILVDPIGAMLAILVFEYIIEVESGGGFSDVFLVLLRLIGIGLVVGALFGYSLVWLIRNRHIPDFLIESTTLLTVIAAFAIAESLQHEAGLITVTVMGIWLANSKGIRLQEILHFKENLSVLLISALFVLLAARLEVDAVLSLGIAAIAFLFIIQFLIRPLVVWMCTLGSGWSWQERVLLGWIAPRGIVAAAISSLFVLRLDSVEVDAAELLVPLAFVMIIGTVVFQSLTAKFVADRLGVSDPEPNGALIVGANPVARKIGLALKSAGVKVLLVDRNKEHVRAARLNGLKTFYGHVTSAHAESHLDLSGIGYVLAVSRNQDLNSLAALHFRDEFGTSNIYLVNQENENADEPGELSHDLTAYQFLFSADYSYQKLNNAFRTGAEIQQIEITEAVLKKLTAPKTNVQDGGDSDSAGKDIKLQHVESHSVKRHDKQIAELLSTNIEDNKVLFVVDLDGKVFVYNADLKPNIKLGWHLLYLYKSSGTSSNATKQD